MGTLAYNYIWHVIARCRSIIIKIIIMLGRYTRLYWVPTDIEQTHSQTPAHVTLRYVDMLCRYMQTGDRQQLFITMHGHGCLVIGWTWPNCCSCLWCRRRPTVMTTTTVCMVGPRRRRSSFYHIEATAINNVNMYYVPMYCRQSAVPSLSMYLVLNCVGARQSHKLAMKMFRYFPIINYIPEYLCLIKL